MNRTKSLKFLVNIKSLLYLYSVDKQHRLERSIIRREGLIRRSLNQLFSWSVRNANIPLKSEALESLVRVQFTLENLTDNSHICSAREGIAYFISNQSILPYLCDYIIDDDYVHVNKRVHGRGG